MSEPGDEDPSSSSHSDTHPRNEEEFIRPPPRTMGVEYHLTASEDDLLNADFWFKDDEITTDPNTHACDRERVKRFYDCSISSIRDAYLSIKEKTGTSDHLLSVLRDELASWVLIHFAFCLHCIYRTLCELNQLQLSLRQKFCFCAPPPAESEPVRKDKPSGSTSQPSMDHFTLPRELEEQNTIVNRQCIKCNLKYRKEMDLKSQTDVMCGLEKFLLVVEEEFIISSVKQEAEEHSRISIKIRHLLVILKEMLFKMEIHPAVSEYDRNDMETTEVSNAAKSIEGTDAENTCNSCGGLLNPGFVGRYVVDEETVKLMDSVEALVGQLWDGFAEEVSTLSDLINSVCAWYQAGTEFHNIG